MPDASPPDALLPADEAWVTPVGRSVVETAESERQVRRHEKRHRSMLWISAFVVLMTCLLQVRPDHRVGFRWGPDIPLPESCGSKVFFGIECPGCGLTRGFIHLSRGDIWSAWQLNRVSWLLAIVLLAQFPYRLWSLRQLRRPVNHQTTWPKWFGVSLVVILIGNWVLKTIGV